MGFIKEPKQVDFSMKSEPWSEEEVTELSIFIKKSKAAKLAREKRRLIKKTKVPVLHKK